MQIKRTFVFIFASFLCLSCSMEKVHLEEEEDLTLRKTVNTISSETFWTQELDASILSESVKGADGVSRSTTALPENVFASGNEEDYVPVYPGLKDFPTLDTRILNQSAKSNLNGFCNAVVEKKSADSFMDSSSIYALVIFNYDINREGKKFNRYVLGQPFLCDDLYQCPVRFFEKSGYTDVVVYLDTKKGNKICALDFSLKESSDGSD